MRAGEVQSYLSHLAVKQREENPTKFFQPDQTGSKQIKLNSNQIKADGTNTGRLSFSRASSRAE
jgi:hypothetical protein